MKWIGLLARLVMGGVWLVAGYEKSSDPAGTVRAVRAFQLLPESVVPAFGHLLPVAEMLIGVCLLVGVLTRGIAVVSAMLLISFIIGISSAWMRGLEIQCGCFGGGGYAENAAAGYARDIVRDLALVLASGWLVWRPRSPLAVDNVLFPTTERDTDVEQGIQPLED
ncbi:MAG TPA: MauE/DoxX family redox-associated membrane protein [Marmoricola sp.]|nr:MauE/DoxX family redox-associated membrane protein [Marmoricola sp.]